MGLSIIINSVTVAAATTIIISVVVVVVVIELYKKINMQFVRELATRNLDSETQFVRDVSNLIILNHFIHFNQN